MRPDIGPRIEAATKAACAGKLIPQNVELEEEPRTWPPHDERVKNCRMSMMRWARVADSRKFSDAWYASCCALAIAEVAAIRAEVEKKP